MPRKNRSSKNAVNDNTKEFDFDMKVSTTTITDTRDVSTASFTNTFGNQNQESYHISRHKLAQNSPRVKLKPVKLRPHRLTEGNPQSNKQEPKTVKRKKPTKALGDIVYLVQADTCYTAKAIIRHMMKAKRNLVLEEYARITAIPIDGKIYQKSKGFQNRYYDIPCLEATRVTLINGPNGNDYIHANYVDGYKHSKAYICTQGPKQETIEDFWYMVWQEQVSVIAMLTKCLESDKIKCVQYWPIIEDQTLKFGSFKVFNRKVQERKSSTYFELCIIRTKNNQEEVRPMVLLQFCGWPDYGIPQECNAFLRFVDLVRRVQKGFATKKIEREEWKGHPLGPPIIVHCSAGVGRTGTFCAVDIGSRKLIDNGRLDVENMIRLVRMQRAKSVQTSDQYQFVYLCLVHFIIQLGIDVANEEIGSQKRYKQRG